MPISEPEYDARTAPDTRDAPDAPDPPAILLRGATKRYREKDGTVITAVNGIDLEVPSGTCLGLLGPNGAGKSTTMRMLTAQSRANEGSIEVLGHKIPDAAKQARALMGVVPQIDNLDEDLTARQNLEVFAHLYRVPRALRAGAVDRALDLAQLGDRQHTRTVNLSGGMRRRLLIARGLVHTPRLVLLDEPTVGLDPQVRAELWGLITDLRAAGVTVLMSTHYIEEAERLADDCALMSHGEIAARGSPADLIAEHAGKRVEEHEGAPGRLAEIEDLARDAGLPTRRTGPTVSVLRAENIPPSLADHLAEHANGAKIVRRATNLEDVFVMLTGESVD